MAKFKTGDRVRVIDVPPIHGVNEDYLLGLEGTVQGYDTVANRPRLLPVAVRLDAHSSGYSDGLCRFEECNLAPIIDTGADAFIESIKKLKPLHEEPKAPKRVTAGDIVDAAIRHLNDAASDWGG